MPAISFTRLCVVSPIKLGPTNTLSNVIVISKAALDINIGNLIHLKEPLWIEDLILSSIHPHESCVEGCLKIKCLERRNHGFGR
jgi:hypothetical protein